MVNTGQPSEACIRCRTRRVKCDATKPSCGNCFRLGATCPGYPESPSITFRDDTDKTRARAERMYRSLQSRTDDQGRPDSTSSENSSDLHRTEHPGHRRSTTANPQSTSVATEISPEPSLNNEVVAGAIEALSKHLDRRGFATYVDRIHDAVSMYPAAGGPLKTSIELLALSAFADSHAGAQYQPHSATDRMRSKITKEMNTALDHLKAGAGGHEQILLAVEVTLLIDSYFSFRYSTATEVESRMRTHFDGMSAIVNHAGPSLLSTELGRDLYVNVFMCHIHAYSPLTDLPPIPGPENGMEILLQSYSVLNPEYRALPLLQRSFNLRREAMQIFIYQPNNINVEVITNIKSATEHLRRDLEALWARLPAARKFGNAGMCRWLVNAHWVHRILVEDTQMRCLRALRLLQGQSHAYSDEIAFSIQKAQLAVRAICQGLPYSFTEADLPSPEEEVPTIPDVLFAWNGYNPLLICSMVDVLTEEQHAGISYARAACARAAGLKQPIATLPRILLQVD